VQHEIIKKYIREVLSFDGLDGAGIIVLKNTDNGWKVLVLKTDDGLDITKGHLDPGESVLQGAKRETKEEASISELNFEWAFDSYRQGPLMLYIASTTQEPKIKRNPISGVIEHEWAKFVDFDFAIKHAYDYLQPALLWAKNKVTNT
jgi:8-oxo-dGTP pyrophosphatase MutT (NUDIX family)